MFAIQGLNKLGNVLTPQELHPAPGGRYEPITPFKLPTAATPPKFIRSSDLRPSTMKVLGKSNPNAIVLSKDPGVPGTDSMLPHYGNFRNQPSGLLTNEKYKPAKLIERPDSAFAFLHTKLKELK